MSVENIKTDKELKGAYLTGERPLFHGKKLHIEQTIFNDGESPLKESRDIVLENSSFQWKYPLWYCKHVDVKECTWFDMARAGVWYTDDISVRDSIVEAPKNFRRCRGVTLTNVNFPNAEETLWNCTDVNLSYVQAHGDYFAMNCKNMQLDDSAVQLLCDRVEGNLLAAKQELDKLHLLHPTGILTAEQIVNAVSDSSRYDVYALMDTIALGQSERCIKILNVLRQEGTEPPIVLWALTREIRTLYAIRQGIDRGLAYETICQKERIWGKRKQTLKRCAERLSISTLEDLLKTSQYLDKVIKGMGTGSPWLMLSDIAITLSGKRLQLTSFS